MELAHVCLKMVEFVRHRGKVFKWIWRAAFSCFTLLVGCTIHRFVICTREAFDWDEAAHALKGFLIAHDVRNGDGLGFLYDTYRQVYWPPLHSWLTGIAFLLCGPSTGAARTVSLIFFLLGAFFVYLAALQLGERRREIAASVSALLFLTAPMLVLLSGRAMLEATGICFMSLTLCIYIWLNTKAREASAHLWLGIAIGLTYFTKSNYGVLLILVWIMATLLHGGVRALFSRSSRYVALPLVVAFAVWFAYVPKIHSTWLTLVNFPFGTADPHSLQGLLYYPKVALHFFGSVWQSVIPLIALLAALKSWRSPGIRFLLLLASLQFGLAIFHHTRVERHIVPMIPALALITGHVFAQAWDVAGNTALRWGVRIVALGLCLFGVVRLPAAFPTHINDGHPEVADAVLADVGENRALVLGTTELRNPSPPLLDWQLASRLNALAVMHSGVVMNFEEDRAIWRTVRKLPLPSALRDGLKRVTSRGEEPARMRSVYFGIVQEHSYRGDPEKARALLRSMDASNRFELIGAMTVNSSQCRYPFEFIDEVVQPLGFEHVSTKSFPGTNIRYDVYRRQNAQ